MKRFGLFLCMLLTAVGLRAQTVTPAPILSGQQIQLPLSNPPVPPASVSAHVTGNAGTATYYYWVVANDPIGNSVPSKPAIAVGVPNVLDSSHYVTVSWTAAPGAISYDVLRTSIRQPPQGNCICAVSRGVTASSIQDQGNSLGSYAVSTFDSSSRIVQLINKNDGLGQRLTVSFGGGQKFSVGSDGDLYAKSIEHVLYAAEYCSSPGLWDRTCIDNAVAALPASGGVVSTQGIVGALAYAGDVDITKPMTLLIGDGTTLQISEATSSSCDAGITSCGDLHIDHTNNVKVVCANPNTSVIEPMINDGNGAYSTLWIDNSSYVEVVGCKILQGNVTGRTNVYGAVRVLDSNHVRLTSNHIAASAGVGIHAIQMTDGAISDNFIDGTQADGIHLSRASARVTVSDNVIENTGDDGIGLVGYLNSPTNYAPVSDITVVGNILLNNGTAPAGRGIACDGCARTRIAHNIVVNPQLACILVAGEPDSAGAGNATRFPFGVSIEDNSLYGCGQDHSGGTFSGVYATSVRDLHVANNVIQSPYGDGITLNTSGIYASIVNNQIEQPGQRGISIIPTTQTSSANGRLITELWSNFGDGTPTSVGWSHIDVRGNSISNPGLEGVYPQWDGTTRITQLSIEGNDVKGVSSSYYALNASGVDGVQVNANTITGTNYGIGIYNTVGGLVYNNALSGIGTGGGILSISSSKLLIVGNNPGNGIFSDSGSSGNTIAFNNLVGQGTITVQSGSAVRFHNFGDSASDDFPNGITTASMSVGGVPLSLASPSDGNCLVYRASASQFQPGSCGAAYSAQTFSNGSAQSAFPSGVTANQLSLYAVEIPTSLQASKISYWVNAGDATTTDAYSLGVYNASGTLVAHAAPIDWQYSGTARTDSLVEGTVTLPAGMYFIGLTGSAATATLYSVCGAQKSFVDFASSSYAATTAGALPATITAPTLAPAQACAPYIFLNK